MSGQLFLFVILLWWFAKRKSFLKHGERTHDHMIIRSTVCHTAIRIYDESRQGRLGDSNANGKNGEDCSWISSDSGGPRNHRELERYQALFAHLHDVSEAWQPARSAGQIYDNIRVAAQEELRYRFLRRRWALMYNVSGSTLGHRSIP
jgi:hypothetical protein